MKRQAVDNDHLGRLGPRELKLQDARLTPEQTQLVVNTTGCTPDVRYHNCRTHRSMLIVYGPPYALRALRAAVAHAAPTVERRGSAARRGTPAPWPRPGEEQRETIADPHPGLTDTV